MSEAEGKECISKQTHCPYLGTSFTCSKCKKEACWCFGGEGTLCNDCFSQESGD